jgi:hypothetical protein
MATTRFADHLLTGIHSARPAASAVPAGTLYSCTTHSLIYQSDGISTWSTYATLGGSGGVIELSYVEFTSPVTISATTEGAANTVVTAGAFTAAGSTKYCIECYSPGAYFGSNSPATVRHVLYEASTVIGQIGIQGGFSGTESVEMPFYTRTYLTPSAGSRTYSWRAFRLNVNGGVDVGAGGSGNYMPGYIRITSGG